MSYSPNKPRKQKQNLKILYADDSPVDFTFYKTVITENLKDTHNVRIDNCESLADIVKKLDITPDYDLILLDLNLLDSRGEETYERLKESTRGIIPIVIVTGLDDIKIRNQCIKAGAGDFLVKGVNDNNLIGIILSFVFEQEKLRKNIKNFQIKL